MIPEALIAMLACARIGAIHSVVFSAFSADALNARIIDGKAKILITSDGYYRKGKAEDLIKKAKLDYPKIDFRVGSAEDLPFGDKLFDVVILGDVLEHVNNETKSLNEIHRVLKPKGKLFLIVSITASRCLPV